MPHCYRKVIHIKAEDSPNVQAALMRKARGLDPGNEILIEGVLPYADYKKRRETWDPVAQCIGLDAQFWEGAEVLLYPPAWLNRAEAFALDLLMRGVPRQARCIGCDPGEGTASTCWSVVDSLGLLELLSIKTPDTSVIMNDTKGLMKKWGVPPEGVVFDRGGGGKQIADTMRAQGLSVRTVAFGEAVSQEPQRFKGAGQAFADRINITEERYAYKNRRAEMYGTLREMLDPGLGYNSGTGFGIPAVYTELRRQLAPIPLLYDNEGRLFLPPKGRQFAGELQQQRGAPTQKTMIELIGCSPDEADSLVLAIHGLTSKAKRPKASVA